MKVIHRLQEFLRTPQPVILTIGNFDGMHLGHQKVIQALKEVAKLQHAQTAVLTFENHPSTVLNPQNVVSQLCTLDHKLCLLEQAKIDWVVLLPFTLEFANQTAEIFLRKLHAHIPFIHLILGHDAFLGKDRKGDQTTLKAIANQLEFSLLYLPEYRIEATKISSSTIRQLIVKGKLPEASQLLGRPYSFYGRVKSGQGKGRRLGFPTANFDVTGMCLPPYGVYAVKLWRQGIYFPAIANLGVAPTMREGSVPILEVHLLDATLDNLPNTFCEVVFHSFIRPEQKFPSIEHLKAQISRDVIQARHYLA
ncbi:bifunctional riboflavin kinase/FAD synthetase [Parachlamydia sp. AcF125]|uniref:bifunctional riboflavin kinase/FAD synthetase n=1 Tax=Parachlamydia sp. AcF125 TaxID=2795736 RepID=UPI001BC98F13|nr:bifunctional riboflavin kinase/FAD synthetase [Parachlamydia sp. AcF125]MBS4168834.1 Riboflavin biosynthesis protein RibF [Parachlamydia sp. AcF125]